MSAKITLFYVFGNKIDNKFARIIKRKKNVNFYCLPMFFGFYPKFSYYCRYLNLIKFNVMTLNCVVVDDSAIQRLSIVKLIENHSSLNLIAEYSSALETKNGLNTHKVDLIFLDIEMPKVDGMEVARSLSSLKKVPLIVFATAYPQFAAEAFRVHAMDYLLKPYDEEQLRQTIARVEELLQPPQVEVSPKRIDRLPVETEGEIHYIPTGDILYAHREEKWTKIVTRTRDYETRMTLKEVESRLTRSSFFRIHKSILVNLAHVSSLTPWFNGAYQLEVDQRPEKLAVSRNYVKELRQRLEG